MLITYQNHNGGTNNLIVVTEDFKGFVFSGVVGTSTKSERQAIANFKRNYKRHYKKAYKE